MVHVIMHWFLGWWRWAGVSGLSVTVLRGGPENRSEKGKKDGVCVSRAANHSSPTVPYLFLGISVFLKKLEMCIDPLLAASEDLLGLFRSIIVKNGGQLGTTL